MYRPNEFINDDVELALELVREFPLGLLISHSPQGVETSYLPFYVEQTKTDVFLYAHLAKANVHWRRLKKNVLVNFQGPQAYISPTVFGVSMNVPTWNYAVVQISGEVELLTNPEELTTLLMRSVEIFEAAHGTRWTYQLPQEMKKTLEAAIIGVKMRVTKIESKFKLSQNRTAADYAAILSSLDVCTDEKKRDLRRWMQKVSGDPKN